MQIHPLFENIKARQIHPLFLKTKTRKTDPSLFFLDRKRKADPSFIFENAKERKIHLFFSKTQKKDSDTNEPAHLYYCTLGLGISVE